MVDNIGMKKIALLLLSAALFCSAAFAETTVKALPIDEADYAEIAATILDVQAPYVKGDYIIFTPLFLHSEAAKDGTDSRLQACG